MLEIRPPEGYPRLERKTTREGESTRATRDRCPPRGSRTMSDTHDEDTAVAEPIVTTRTEPRAEVDSTTNTQRQPPYNVVILNDEEHTFDYVIELLTKLFAHPLA